MNCYKIKPKKDTKWSLFYDVLFYYIFTAHLLPYFVSRVYTYRLDTWNRCRLSFHHCGRDSLGFQPEK